MSESVHIREILPDVMRDIRKRMELNRQKRVLSAVRDYLSHKKKRRKKQTGRVRRSMESRRVPV